MTLFNSPLPSPPSGSRGTRTRKFAYWYDAIIEWLLANPNGNLTQCAKDLNRAPQTLYIVTNSDVFKLRYEQRRKEHFENLSQGILLRTARVASKALDILEERMTTTPEKISTSQILDTANSTLERLGYGTPAAPQTNISVNAQPQVAVTIAPDVLFDAREKMRAVQSRNAEEQPTAKQISVVPIAPPVSVLDAIFTVEPPSNESSS